MPAARRTARTSISGAMSGAASELDAIWRAMSASDIASTLAQSVLTTASAAALLNFFAMPLHLARIGFAQRYDPPRRASIDEHADERPTTNMPEGHLPNFPVVETIIVEQQMCVGEKNLSKRQRNAVLGAICLVLCRIEFVVHNH